MNGAAVTFGVKEVPAAAELGTKGDAVGVREAVGGENILKLGPGVKEGIDGVDGTNGLAAALMLPSPRLLLDDPPRVPGSGARDALGVKCLMLLGVNELGVNEGNGKDAVFPAELDDGRMEKEELGV